MVGGRPPFDLEKGSYGSQGSFNAAKALGMSIIVLDRPGHWLQDERYSHLRNEFLPIDMDDEV